MLRPIVLVCLVAVAAAKEAAVNGEVAVKPAAAEEQTTADLAAEASVKDKRQVAYGAPGGLAPSFNDFGGYFGGGFGGNLGGGFAGGFGGGKCRDETKYVLTWTKTVIPVTEYDTRTEYLPSTLYKYLTETQYYPLTQVQLVTTTRAGGREYQEETKIAYRTDTVVVPQVETVYSTLVFTDDEHVTVTETDTFTQTQTQQYPVEVTVTSVQRVPQIQTSVVREYQTQYQTQYETNQYEVVQTQTVDIPQVQYITQVVTQQRYQTVAVTRTRQQYHTVTKCQQQQQAGYGGQQQGYRY